MSSAAAAGAESQEANVCVAVRCRPASQREASAGGPSAVSFPGPERLSLRGGDGQEHRFVFDHVLQPGCAQEQVFVRLGEPLLERAFAGFHGTVLAYGQTGSGKTHTMLAHRVPPEDRGLIPRLADALFARVAALRESHQSRSFLVCCSFLEIYNEAIFDLLVPRARQAKAGLEVKEQRGIGVYVKDLTEVVVESPDRLAESIDRGFENRATAATKMNEASSRSHCVFTVKLHQKDAEDQSMNTFSRLNLVDLAGSERAKATEADGTRLKEGANINKSLSALGHVISALSSNAQGSKKAFVPYRNSKLTRVLQDSLGGNSLCTMVATIGPGAGNAEETLSTLNYAKRAKVIRVTATKNEQEIQVGHLDEEVRALRQKLDRLETLPRGTLDAGAVERRASDGPAPAPAAAAAARPQSKEEPPAAAAAGVSPASAPPAASAPPTREEPQEPRERLPAASSSLPGPAHAAEATSASVHHADIFPDEEEEEEAMYKARIAELQALMEQSWDEKQRLTRRHEEELRAAQLEAERAAQQVALERQRNASLLEQSGDVHATLQALGSACGGSSSSRPACLRRVPEVLGLERQLASQLHCVRLYRESAAADLRACQGHALQEVGATLTLLYQVQAKLSSMTAELMALGKLEAQLQEELGFIGPELALARRLASDDREAEAVADGAHPDGLRPWELLAVLERQLARHHARMLAFVDDELQKLALSSETEWLVQSLRGGAAGAAGAGALEGQAELLEALQSRAAAVAERQLAGAGGAEVGPPGALGLASGDLPDGAVGASSNGGAACSARLLRPGAFGGWCPRGDSPEEYLEVDLQEESLVTGISIQGREACTGEPAQTRDLLRLVMAGSTIELPGDEKSFQRPPVRLVHNVGVLMAHVWGCFGSAWQVPDELFNFPVLSREQKSEFFSELIAQTESALKVGQPGRGARLALTPEDILHGRSCTEVNRLLQMLALLGLRRVPGPAGLSAGGGLLDVCPQWTTRWRLRLFCERRGWLWWNYAAADGACASDSDDEDVPASESGAHLFPGSGDPSSVEFLALPHAVWASRLRVYPAEWQGHAALRLEVHAARRAADGGPRAPALARGRRSRDLEGWALLACKCALALQVDLEARQSRSHQAEAEVAAEEGARRERAEEERDAVSRQLAELCARSEELGRQRDAFERRTAEAKTAWLQAHVECQMCSKEASRLEAGLEAASDSGRRAREERDARLEERDSLSGSIEDLSAQLQVVMEERDHSRAEEERLFGLLASKEAELEDTSNGYIRLTERLQEKLEELQPFREQAASLEEEHLALGTRLTALLEEELEIRLEQQRTRTLLAETQQAAAALRARSDQLEAEGVDGAMLPMLGSHASWRSPPAASGSPASGSPASGSPEGCGADDARWQKAPSRSHTNLRPIDDVCRQTARSRTLQAPPSKARRYEADFEEGAAPDPREGRRRSEPVVRVRSLARSSRDAAAAVPSPQGAARPPPPPAVPRTAPPSPPSGCLSPGAAAGAAVRGAAVRGAARGGGGAAARTPALPGVAWAAPGLQKPHRYDADFDD